VPPPLLENAWHRDRGERNLEKGEGIIGRIENFRVMFERDIYKPKGLRLEENLDCASLENAQHTNKLTVVNTGRRRSRQNEKSCRRGSHIIY
jgi:hypothetical protein